MNRNQKIAIGCGGAGCLGLIVVVIAGSLIYYFSGSSTNRNYNFNSNYNRNSNYNSNYNTNTNANDDTSSSSSLSDDDKHKLFQAAGVTKDNLLILRVLKKIGFENGTGEGYQDFVKEHFPWAMKNVAFIQSVNTEEKARAYVDAHIDD